MTAFQSIVDPSDPRVAPFRDIRERDMTRRGEFIAEGTVVLAQLLQSQAYRPTGILVLENRLAGLSDLLATVPADVPIYVANRAVIDAIAGFPMHRGVLAHGVVSPGASIDPEATAVQTAKDGGVVVVAVGIANHDNMGAIFRNAAAFGAGAVLLDETSCDPLYRKAIRVSAGAVFRLPSHRLPMLECFRILAQAGFRTVALSPGGRPDLSMLDDTEPTALFLGAEGPGLPVSVLERMACLRIGMASGFDSLNVATSAAIALQRLFEARNAPGNASPSAETKDR